MCVQVQMYMYCTYMYMCLYTVHVHVRTVCIVLVECTDVQYYCMCMHVYNVHCITLFGLRSEVHHTLHTVSLPPGTNMYTGCVDTLHSTTRMMLSCSIRSCEVTMSLTLPIGTKSQILLRTSSAILWSWILGRDTHANRPSHTHGEL